MSRPSYSLFVTQSATDPGAALSDGVAASSTNTYYSKPFFAEEGFGLEVVTSGTLTGTWTLWKCDKERPTVADDTDWVDISTHADFVETNPAGSTTKWTVNSTLIRAKRLRLKYVNASGTGNLFAYASPAA